MPPPGTSDSGSDDPPSESSDTATSETYLVMSGGEGYIDFRMGECVTPQRYTDCSPQWSQNVVIMSPLSEKQKTRLLLNPCDWSCCICIKQKTVFSSVSKWVHCWHHLPPQAMKALSWMVYQSQQKASSQPPARQNEATSSSGRSWPPMNEKTSKKTKTRLSCRLQSRPPTPPHAHKFFIWYFWLLSMPE